MAELVSPCCGAEYTDNKDGLSYCCDAPIINGLCSRKKCLEHAEPAEGFVCDTCDEFFEESIKDYEYEEKQHDSHLEDRIDEKKLGL